MYSFFSKNLTINIKDQNMYKASVRRFFALFLAILMVSSFVHIPVYAEEEPIGTAICTASKAMNLRSGPGTSYEKSGSLPAKTVVDVYEIKGEWYRILYNGAFHWANGDYL
ncbi:MAG: SH3 domain-containing protein, partial [Clostridiales bacterium]|nr:SH3 domain-containing protein [Clostridiales bacterium]